jgi:hypothetical protein
LPPSNQPAKLNCTSQNYDIKTYQHFRGTCCFQRGWRRLGSSETSIHTYQTTKQYTVQDSCLRAHSRKNPKTRPALRMYRTTVTICTAQRSLYVFTVFSQMCLSHINDVCILCPYRHCLRLRVLRTDNVHAQSSASLAPRHAASSGWE